MLTIDINNPQEHCNLACTFCYSWNLEKQLNLTDIQRIVQEHPIDSPLLHSNTCPALASAYGFSKQGICPAETGQKKYVSSAGVSGCEFLPKQQLVRLGMRGVQNA